MTKTKNYINDFLQLVKLKALSPYRWLKSIHHKIMVIEYDDVEEYKPKNAYEVFSEWMLDVVQFGFVFAVTLNLITGWMGFYRFLSLLFISGMGKWMIIAFTREIANTIKKG